MSGNVPDAVRPYLDGHIEASYPSATPLQREIDRYSVNPTYQGKTVHFVGLLDGDGISSSGTGILHVLAHNGKGHLEIHSDNFFGNQGKHYVFTLPESLYRKLGTDNGKEFFLEGRI